ncbi:glutathione-disulfide reductase [Rhodanobacter lindaniclasticus]
MTASHDLIVLGAGSGGLATAFRAAKHGARVALLEPRELGGTCVHRGCVPKKAMWIAAQWAQEQHWATALGFAAQPGPLDWRHFRDVRAAYIERIDRRYAERLQQAGVEVVPQAAHFVARDTVELADGSRRQAPHVVIATGARPRTLEIPGFDLGLVSDDIFALDAAPRRVAIVGGGYIATEFAGLLRALGCRVELLARGRLLAGFDAEVVQALREQMHGQGIVVHLGTDVRAARRGDDGIVLDDAAVASTRGPYDAVLWAVGRSPNTESLGLDAIGVTLDGKGHVATDVWQDTNVAGIHALGDVTGRHALTPVAVAAGRALADRLFGGQRDARLDYDNIPSVVFSKPPLGRVGLTEDEARERHGEAVRVHRSRFTPMAWALVGKREQSLMKLVCVGEDERVVGIHLLGPGADEMLQGFAVALKRGICKRDLDATVAIHPTSAEELVLMD